MPSVVGEEGRLLCGDGRGGVERGENGLGHFNILNIFYIEITPLQHTISLHS
jgi:hypothetical protein